MQRAHQPGPCSLHFRNWQQFRCTGLSRPLGSLCFAFEPGDCCSGIATPWQDHLDLESPIGLLTPSGLWQVKLHSFCSSWVGRLDLESTIGLSDHLWTCAFRAAHPSGLLLRFSVLAVSNCNPTGNWTVYHDLQPLPLALCLSCAVYAMPMHPVTADERDKASRRATVQRTGF